MAKEEEKRRSQRKREETLVRFEGENFSIYSKATDISDWGAFVATHYLLDPGTKIALHVIDTDGSESRTDARVVRSYVGNKDTGSTLVGLGIEFLQRLPVTTV